MTLLADLAEGLLDQLNSGRGIEDFLLVEIDILHAVLPAVYRPDLIFRYVDAQRVGGIMGGSGRTKMFNRYLSSSHPLIA